MLAETLRGVLADLDDSVALGAALAPIEGGCVIYLHGELGVGKSTVARALLRHLGVQGTIRSPTYTLVEPYQVGTRSAYHLDLYRVTDASELQYLGMRELDSRDAIWLIEWPDRACSALPKADVVLELAHREHGRDFVLRALSERALIALPSVRTMLAERRLSLNESAAKADVLGAV